MNDCSCAIALRVATRLAAEAISKLSAYSPKAAARLIRESNARARGLRKSCDAGDHGPHPKEIGQ
jgi:hypothetical protein